MGAPRLEAPPSCSWALIRPWDSWVMPVPETLCRPPRPGHAGLCGSLGLRSLFLWGENKSHGSHVHVRKAMKIAFPALSLSVFTPACPLSQPSSACRTSHHTQREGELGSPSCPRLASLWAQPPLCASLAFRHLCPRPPVGTCLGIVAVVAMTSSTSRCSVASSGWLCPRPPCPLTNTALLKHQ